MAYKVTITYTGPADPSSIRMGVSPICSCYIPNNTYINTPAYEGTVYDTNVEGWGEIDLMEPYATTSFPFPVPLSQFKLAVVGEEVKNSAGIVIGRKIEFNVDTYMEAFYYTEAGKALEVQGFTVTVDEVTS